MSKPGGGPSDVDSWLSADSQSDVETDAAGSVDVYVEGRTRLVEWLGRQLIGPAARTEDGYQLNVSPLERFPMGVLGPLESGESLDPVPASTSEDGDLENRSLDDEEDVPHESERGRSDDSAVPMGRSRYVPPSSVGFSFFVRGDARLRIEASGAVYSPVDPEARDQQGRYQSRFERSELERETALYRGGGFVQKDIWDGRANIDVRARPHGGGMILTVTLFNQQVSDRAEDPRLRNVNRIERSLFEAGLKCFVDQGEIVDYPRVDPSLLTDEEHELELQYRERRVFAVGHGAAVDWIVVPGKPSRIWSDFLPRAETPMMSGEPRGDARALEIERLADCDLPLELLQAFVRDYGEWVRECRREAKGLEDERDREAADRICSRMENAHGRMFQGVQMLAGEPDAAFAFRLANRAMLRQMVNWDGRGANIQRWRPFQLGFLLTTMESTISDRDDHRDLLDLIWFQTGGGKTEAYLGLIAFLLVWRRLRYGEKGGGTGAFMRYTLRLLTGQQFERAARLICALELIRREQEAGRNLGEEPFSVGIWVGKDVCPNQIDEAAKIVDKIRATEKWGAANDNARKRLLISRCPWCRERLDSERGYEAIDRDLRFHCSNLRCEFGQGGGPLPCRLVDESLYEHPPSLLIATIDKFAHLAWEERASVFFGSGRNCRAPDLVVQDELHLISGPLGSVAGLYEAGVETALRCRGVTPKYIASTATIRMAEAQVKALYGRDLAVFPPPGLSCDDSWFARIDRTRPGRLYVGYLAPLRSEQHSLAPLAAALLTAPLTVFRDDVDQEDLFDAWWTNVVYHGSLRGVGMSSNALQSEVREFGEQLIEEYIEARTREVDGGSTGDPSSGHPAHAGAYPVKKELRRRLYETQVEQLWSRRTAEQIAETFERLSEPRGAERCLDVVLSTNMVSAGLDVSRLALMVVNGQPLTTAEYVQATSRVGRGEAPGVVVTNYYRHQARSLSHYESFRPYHESFYRFVEPSSVTPYTFQVRKRALHAALVIALRHACNELAPNSAAGNLDPRQPRVRSVVAEFERRIERASPEKAREVKEHINRLLREWHGEAERCRASSEGLRYQARDKAYARLLYGQGDGIDSPKLWMTMHTMRNVERPATLGMR